MVYLGTNSDSAAGSNGSNVAGGKNGSSPPIVELDSDSPPPSQQRNGDSNGGPITRDSKDSRGGADDSGSDEDREAEGQIRVGKDYQVNPPPYISPEDRRPDQCQERALLVWSPNSNLPQNKLDEYIQVSKEKYGYNAEQALGMLFWHKHDLDRAIQDLANFTPFPDEWTVEDKVLFEQAFQFHGKSFHRIRQMLPDKTIAQLVKYYYGWKKTRTRTSLMDRQARKLQVQREAGKYGSNGSSDGTGNSGEADTKTDQIMSDEEDEEATSSTAGANNTSSSSLGTSTTSSTTKPKCFNCGILCHVTHATPKGQMCGTCHQYYQRTGNIRPTTTPMRRDGTRGAQKMLKNSSKPPRGMYINHDDLVALATGPNTQGEQILKSMDREIISYKRVVQQNKQLLSSVMKKVKDRKNLDPYRVPDPASRINARWTNEELLLGVQGVRKFGKNFKVIAEVIGTKTESHVRSFYVNYRRRYNLDSALKEYEAEHGPTPNDDVDLSAAGDKSGSASRSNSGNNSPSHTEESKSEEPKGAAEINGAV